MTGRRRACRAGGQKNSAGEKVQREGGAPERYHKYASMAVEKKSL